jgi:hypothetical protein
MDWWEWAPAAAGYAGAGAWTAWVMTLACHRMDVREYRQKGMTVTPALLRKNAGGNTGMGVFLGLIWPLTLVLRYPVVGIMWMRRHALEQMEREFLPPPDLRESEHGKDITGRAPWTGP